MKWTTTGPDAANIVQRARPAFGNDPDIIITSDGPDRVSFDCPDFELQPDEWQHRVKLFFGKLVADGFQVEQTY